MPDPAENGCTRPALPSCSFTEQTSEGRAWDGLSGATRFELIERALIRVNCHYLRDVTPVLSAGQCARYKKLRITRFESASCGYALLPNIKLLPRAARQIVCRCPSLLLGERQRPAVVLKGRSLGIENARPAQIICWTPTKLDETADRAGALQRALACR